MNVTRLFRWLSMPLFAVALLGCGKEATQTSGLPSLQMDYSAVLNGTSVLNRAGQEQQQQQQKEPDAKLLAAVTKKVEARLQGYHDAVVKLEKAVKDQDEAALKAAAADVAKVAKEILADLMPLVKEYGVGEKWVAKAGIAKNALAFAYAKDEKSKPSLVVLIAMKVKDGKVQGFELLVLGIEEEKKQEQKKD